VLSLCLVFRLVRDIFHLYLVFLVVMVAVLYIQHSYSIVFKRLLVILLNFNHIPKYLNFLLRFLLDTFIMNAPIESIYPECITLLSLQF
jgi:hypothetical protein